MECVQQFLLCLITFSLCHNVKRCIIQMHYFSSSVIYQKSVFLNSTDDVKPRKWLCYSAPLHYITPTKAPIHNGFPDRTDVLFRSHPQHPTQHWREAVMIKHSGVGCSGYLGSSGAGRGRSEISFLFNTDVSSGPTGSWWPCDLWSGAGGADQNTAAP